MKTIPFDEIEVIPDPHTDARLMPLGMEYSTNRAELRLYKTATRMAMQKFLTPVQREVLEKHFSKGLSKTDIGKHLGMTPSAVCKIINSAIKSLRTQVEYCIAVREELRSFEDG